MSIIEDVIPAQFIPYIDLMKSFKDVLDSCLGFKLDPFYQDRVENFGKRLDQVKKEFGMSESNKLHIVRVHISEFCSEKNESLGKYSEQEVENTHSAYEAVWARYWIKDINHAQYSTRQHQAIMCFNSYNI